MNLKAFTNEELESLSEDIKSEQKRREDLKSNPSSYIVALNQRFQGRFVKIDDIETKTTYCLVHEVVEGIGNSLVKFNISEFTFNNEDMRSMLSIAKKTYTYLDRNYIDNIKIVDKSEIMKYFETVVVKLRESVKINVIESELD